ncbi:MAG: hypothetical protein KGJ13_10375 [Patescibacteria group bacterium]|nr:hypothetical protein [Patescibacteria group bacterium]
MKPCPFCGYVDPRKGPFCVSRYQCPNCGAIGPIKTEEWNYRWFPPEWIELLASATALRDSETEREFQELIDRNVSAIEACEKLLKP